MDPNLTETYKKQYETLTEKLGRLESQYGEMQTNTPKAIERVSLSGRVRGENPLARLKATHNIRNTAESVELQLQALDNLRQELILKAEEEESGGLSEKDMLDYQLKAREQGLKFNPETRKFEDMSPEEAMSTISLKGTSKTDMEMLRAIDSATSEAEKLYEPGYSGMLDSALGWGRIKLNAEGADKEANFRQTISDIQNTIRNYISGAAINESEAKFLKELYPSVTDSDTEIQRKIKGVRDYVRRKAQGILDTGQYNVDAGEYLGMSGKKETQETGGNQIGRFTVEVE